MISANNSSPREQRIPEKVERSEDDPANIPLPDAALKEPKSPAKKSGPGSDLEAASALTALTTSPKEGEKDEPAGEEPVEEFVLPEVYTRSGRKKAIPFPLKLMKVLSVPEYSEIITWLPDGKSFNIIRPKAFTAEILPIHFKEAKYSSFTRKLHRWGFQRHLRGDEAGAFFNKYFVKNRVDLVENMSCHKPRPRHQIPSLSRPGQSMMRRNVPQQHSMPQAGMGQQDNQSHELNEAIELEVSRRLRERIAAASLSRQALAVMQQQVPPSSMAMDPLAMQFNAASMNQARFGSAAAAGMGGGMMNFNPQAQFGAASASAGNMSAASAAAALREAQEQCLLMGVPPNSQNLDSLMQNNPHAKSA